MTPIFWNTEFNFISRYRSFTNWVKTFDEYQRQASKKGFMVDFRKSNDLECPATLTKMPCKGQLSEWRDLNECVFHICEDPFEFGKFFSNNMVQNKSGRSFVEN